MLQTIHAVVDSSQSPPYFCFHFALHDNCNSGPKSSQPPQTSIDTRQPQTIINAGRKLVYPATENMSTFRENRRAFCAKVQLARIKIQIV
jgi:hypothetical protein